MAQHLSLEEVGLSYSKSSDPCLLCSSLRNYQSYLILGEWPIMAQSS